MPVRARHYESFWPLENYEEKSFIILASEDA
jgi:hypothetical protein